MMATITTAYTYTTHRVQLLILYHTTKKVTFGQLTVCKGVLAHWGDEEVTPLSPVVVVHAFQDSFLTVVSKRIIGLR